jgi:hypothetical protein
MAQILSDYMETLFLALARKVNTKLGTNVKKPAHCYPCSNLRLSLKFFFRQNTVEHKRPQKLRETLFTTKIYLFVFNLLFSQCRWGYLQY